MTRRTRGKKLLVASLGVAAVAYACKRNDVSNDPVVGNLVAPEPTVEPEPVTPEPVTPEVEAGGPLEPETPLEPVGNLVPPQPIPETDASK